VAAFPSDQHCLGVERMFRAVRLVRLVGIAIGSLVAAYLAVSLVAGSLLGLGGKDAPLAALVAVILGGLVFADIMRREHRRPEGGDVAST